jgi:hypothetical protein
MEPNHAFLISWDFYMIRGCFALVGVGLLILLYHEFRVFQIKDYKEKYDYVNLHEIRYFWYAVMAFILAAALYCNSIWTEEITSTARGMLFFYVRIFITVSLTLIAYFAFYSMVRIYYPKYLEKRLNKLRNTPRISPDGNKMRKLSEEEEDTHLEADMIAEEANVHSVDYDVWIDDKTGFKKIEKYNSYQHAEECSECGYYTMMIDREEIEKAPTANEPGLLLKHYKCNFCNHREAREVKLAKLSDNVK